MSDNAIRWRLDVLHGIDEAAFSGPAPSPGAGSVTISLWFQADTTHGTQVIANQGARESGQPGWSVYLHEGALCFRVCADDGQTIQQTIALAPSPDFQHFAGVIDRGRGRLVAYLNGSAAGWTADPVDARLPAAPITPEPLVLVGGYTDPAGGHFDHTFGREGSGRVDDLRIFQAALTPEAIRALHAPTHESRPEVRFTARLEAPDAPATVRFDGTATTDPDGQIAAYLWDFGDGGRGFGPAPAHPYAYAGAYTVRLTVIDDAHAQATASQQVSLGGRPNPLRRVPVFVNGTEGYACYRIPAIVRAANGDLLAFAEGRVEDCSDSTSTIHIVCKRSRDNGASWEPLQTIGVNPFSSGPLCVAQNPCPVVDEVLGSGRIVLVFTLAEHSEWDLARGIGVSRMACLTSDDHGWTWSPARDITAAVHRPYNPSYAALYPGAALPENRAAGWRIQRPALGHAIQLHGPHTRGRLFFAGTITQGARSVFESQNYAFWSDDLGATWVIGGVCPEIGLNEATAVELDNGDVIINSRAYREGVSRGRRAITRATFNSSGAIHFGETTLDAALVDPAVQASSLRITPESGGHSQILFANPAHPRARRELTVRLSEDGGQTWAYSRALDPGPAAYSDLVAQADGRIGVLYERGNQGGIAYVSFDLDWLREAPQA